MLPRIAIVGRPNVGKSALFNRLAKRRISIVHDKPGVTRDRIATQCWIGKRDTGFHYELTDTGGIGATLDDGFAKQVRAEADIAINAADLILFVVDGREGVHPIDRELAQLLQRGSTPVFIVANKVDTSKTDPSAAEFAELGFAKQVNVSATHGRNMNVLETFMTKHFAKQEGMSDEPTGLDREASTNEQGTFDEPTLSDQNDEPPVKIAIVGRPNVGKSSLVNAILNDERTIVSNVAGTTRDSVDVPYSREGKDYVLIDTAGIRRRTKRDTSVEVFSVMRSEKAIERADICLLVVDASTGIVAQDRRIARMVLDARKPCVLLLNKFDLYFPEASFQDRIENFREDMGEELFFLDYAPRVAISAKERQYLGKIFKKIQKVKREAQDPVPTGQLNRLLRDSIDRNPPPAKKGKRMKLLYATQKRDDKPGLIPVPEYMLFLNYANLLTRTYERYLENKIREKYPMEGLPFVFSVSSRQGRNDDDDRR